MRKQNFFDLIICSNYPDMDIKFQIERLLTERKWNQQKLAKHFNVSQSTIHRWLNEAEPRGQYRDAIRKLYAETYGEIGLKERNMVPVKGHIGAGQRIEAVDNGDLDYIEAPIGTPPETVAAIVRGESMLPVFRDGWVLYWSKKLPPQDMLNQLCIVQTQDKCVFVKTLKRGSQPGLFNLVSFNANDIEDQEIDWAAPIEWIKPR